MFETGRKFLRSSGSREGFSMRASLREEDTDELQRDPFIILTMIGSNSGRQLVSRHTGTGLRALDFLGAFLMIFSTSSLDTNWRRSWER